MSEPHSRLSVFPLGGALLFPRMELPLHIFEPRYKALINDVMARDQCIGMIQPIESSVPPRLFDVGCIGKITSVETLPDGDFNIVVEGVSRFRTLREIVVSTPFRQLEISTGEYAQDSEIEILSMAERAAIEIESQRFAQRHGYAVDWDSVTRLDDESLINGIAQIAPFDIASKQALLEARTLNDRTELLIQLMQFFGSYQRDENGVTLQ